MTTSTPTFSSVPVWDKILHDKAEIAFGEDWQQRGKVDKQRESLEVDHKMIHWEATRLYIKITHYENGREQNYDANEPACQVFDRKGDLISRTFIKNGEYNDPNPGTPAYEKYHDNGVVDIQMFYGNGVWQGTDLESPGRVCYFSNGAVKKIEYIQNETLVDTPSGMPATIIYTPEGTIDGGQSSLANRILTIEETEERVSRAKSNKLAEMMESPTCIALTGSKQSSATKAATNNRNREAI